MATTGNSTNADGCITAFRWSISIMPIALSANQFIAAMGIVAVCRRPKKCSPKVHLHIVEISTSRPVYSGDGETSSLQDVENALQRQISISSKSLPVDQRIAATGTRSLQKAKEVLFESTSPCRRNLYQHIKPWQRLGSRYAAHNQTNVLQ